MKSTQYQTLALRDFFKGHLEERQWSYKILAQKINVSEPTIKRWMTKDDIPFEKVLEILDALSLPFQKLADALKHDTPHKRPTPSKKDEDFIVGHPKEAYILLLISLGYSFDEVCELLHLRSLTLEKHLLSLDKHNLIQFIDSKNIRSLLHPPIKWSPKGSFVKEFSRPLLTAICDEAIHKHQSADDEVSSEFGEMYMGQFLEKEFKNETKKLLNRFKEMARLEKAARPITELRPVSFLFFSGAFSSWKKVMWDC